jgi:hypothetical protein
MRRRENVSRASNDVLRKVNNRAARLKDPIWL